MRKRRAAQTTMVMAILVAAGCGGELPVVEETSAALHGSPPRAQLASNPATLGVSAWSLGAGGNRWERTIVGDVDGDGWDDVCGFYGNSYGCSLRRSLSFSGFWEASVFGPSRYAASERDTVQLYDVDSDGRLDLCGLRNEGLVCQRNTGAGFAPYRVWHRALSHKNGWSQKPYYSTVRIASFSTDPRSPEAVVLCSRGTAGVRCYFRNSSRTGFTNGYAEAAEFSDANFWNQEQYYSTIAYVDVNGDDRTDVCARGVAGIWCATYNRYTRTFNPAKLWTSQFRDAYGWNQPTYYRSIRFGDINRDGKADVCGRGGAGVYCGIAKNGYFSGTSSVVVPAFSNAAGWSSYRLYYASLMLVDINLDGRKDVCGVGPHQVYGGARPEIYCALSASYLTPSFRAAERRTDYSGIDDSEVVKAGRIRTGSRSFCYAVGGNVLCTNK